jgi:ribosomal protein L19E
VIDHLYWYLRALQELRDAGKIDEELYAKLFIDPAIVLKT